MKSDHIANFFFVVSFFGNSSFAQIPDPNGNSGWNLGWGDEFESGAIDFTKWFNPDPPSYYFDGNDQIAARCAANLLPATDPGATGQNNGMMTILTKAEYKQKNIPGTSFLWDYNYTTGMLKSLQKFKFGYFEIRCRMKDDGTVVSPNFWLYGGSDSQSNLNQYYSEIDVFEMKSCMREVVPMNVIVRSDNFGVPTALNDRLHPHCISSYACLDYLSGNNLFGNWHTYGVEWLPDKINHYLDGNLISSINELEYTPTNTTIKLIDLATVMGGNQLQNPNGDYGLCLIVDLNVHVLDKIPCAIPYSCPSCFLNPNTPTNPNGLMECSRGGNWICDPVPSHPYPLPPSPTYPNDENTYDIDYVRTYSLECDLNPFICSSGFTWPLEIRPTITYISGTATVPLGGNYSIRGSDYIEINDGFEIPIGTNFFMDNTPCFDIYQFGN
jgi:beta-glucanase (GH16 family)